MRCCLGLHFMHPHRHQMLCETAMPYHHPHPPAIDRQYWVVPTSNRLQLGASLTRLLDDPTVRRWLASNAAPHNTDSLAGPSTLTGFLLSNPDGGPTTPPNYQGNLLWAAVNYWNLYRFSQDASMLPPLHSLVRGLVNHLVYQLDEEEEENTAESNRQGTFGRWDGLLHLPPAYSPEYMAPDGPGEATPPTRWRCSSGASAR